MLLFFPKVSSLNIYINIMQHTVVVFIFVLFVEHLVGSTVQMEWSLFEEHEAWALERTAWLMFLLQKSKNAWFYFNQVNIYCLPLEIAFDINYMIVVFACGFYSTPIHFVGRFNFIRREDNCFACTIPCQKLGKTNQTDFGLCLWNSSKIGKAQNQSYCHLVCRRIV